MSKLLNKYGRVTVFKSAWTIVASALLSSFFNRFAEKGSKDLAMASSQLQL